ncbi:MAG: hypothetical protein HY328_13715 [Chloroflexi bacterium]|nr:hypothetical protein [Chloroflexota bacterium]
MNRLPTFNFRVWMVAAAAPIFFLLLLRIEQPTTPPSDWPANCEIGAEIRKKEGATCPGCQLQNVVITTTSSGPCLWQVKIQVESQPGIDMIFTPDGFELNETTPIGVSQGHISVDNDVLAGTYPLDVDVAPTTGGQTFHIPLRYTLHVDASVPPPTPIPEEICSLTIQDGWMQPSQGVWQDDNVFPDRPTRQLVRLGPTAFRAELPMVLGRPTLLFGILRPVGEAALDRRNTIEIRGISRGAVNVPVRFRFSVEENGEPPREIYTSEVLSNTLPLLGPCRVDSRPFTFRVDTTDGVPPPKSPDEPTAFTFNRIGPYRLIAEVVRADRAPPNDRTGIRVTVEGTVIETHAPVLQFHPILLSPASAEEQKALKEESDFQARGSQLVADDYFPLKPGTLVAVRHPVRDMSHIVQGVEEGTIAWIKRLFKDAIVARRDLLEAAINAERTLASLLGAGDRVVILMRNQDMDLVRPTAEDWASSPKVIFVRGGGGGSTVVHELAHTLPYLWSRTQMLEQCGRDWHNKPEAVAYGHQIQVFDQEKRRRHHASSTVMGDLVDKDSPRWIARCTYWNLLHILQAKPDPELLLVRGALVFSDTLSAGVLLPAYQTLGAPDLETGDGGIGRLSCATAAANVWPAIR